jgi:zinc/manganese transport system substrate-binding protein
MGAVFVSVDRMSPRLAGLVAAVAAVIVAATGCATTPPGGSSASGPAVLTVVAAENFWGDLAALLGGDYVHVQSIIDNPDADPHDYEPTTADGRAIAAARIVIVNGVGYDAWAGNLVAANPDPHRITLDVGDLVGAGNGDNPHRWYNPDDVRRVIDQITADYVEADPAHAASFGGLHAAVLQIDLGSYFDTIARIRTEYAGTPVGASESIFAMLAPALGLDLLTPPSLLRAVSEGTDPTAADKATVDAQIKNHKIRVYVYNSQNATPDVQAQVRAAKAAGIPVTTITETLTPAGASFADWQIRQLDALEDALARASGK